MRIVLVTQEDPFYLPPALDAFCKARRQDVVGLILLPAFNERLTATAGRLYAFYGPWDFLRLGMRYPGAIVANRLDGLPPLPRPGPVPPPSAPTPWPRRPAFPISRPAKINAPEFIDVLRTTIRPDLLVSIAASQILRKGVLQTPPLGCINLHSAPLPRYQGMMPNFWTMVEGEREAAVTVHYMVERLDAGDIVLQRAVPILPGDSLHDLMVRSKVVGVAALLEAVDQIERGAVTARPMDATRATYFSFPKRADAQRLRRMGRALL